MECSSSSSKIVQEIDISEMKGNELLNQESAIHAWKEFAVGKGFKLTLTTGQKHDKYIYMSCHRSGNPETKEKAKRLKPSKKCSTNFHILKLTTSLDCDFRISLIQKDGKYIIHDLFTKLVHNHELDTSRLLDSKAKDLIQQKVNSTSSCGERLKDIIDSSRKKEANYTTVYNEIRKFRKIMFGKVGDDAYLLVKILQKLKAHHHFDFRYQTNDSQEFQSLIFMSAKMKDCYRLFGDVILLDTTFGTNSFKLSCMVMMGMNEEGKNVVFAIALLSDEAASSFSWAFRSFQEMTDSDPEIICSDGGTGIKGGLKEVFPEVSHFLCGWHVEQNIKKHMASLLRAKGKSQQEIQDRAELYQNLCKALSKRVLKLLKHYLRMHSIQS